MEEKKGTKKSNKQPSLIKTLEKALKIGVKYGVSELKLGEIQVIFGEVSQRTRKPRKAAVKEQQEIQEKANLQMQFNDVQEHIATSHIEDPLAFEEAVVAGLLQDEKNDDSGVEQTL